MHAYVIKKHSAHRCIILYGIEFIVDMTRVQSRLPLAAHIYCTETVIALMVARTIDALILCSAKCLVGSALASATTSPSSQHDYQHNSDGDY